MQVFNAIHIITTSKNSAKFIKWHYLLNLIPNWERQPQKANPEKAKTLFSETYNRVDVGHHASAPLSETPGHVGCPKFGDCGRK